MGEHTERLQESTAGPNRRVLADLGRTRAQAQMPVVATPVLRQQTVDVAAVGARRGRERGELLERGARQNLLAAQEARHVLAQVHQRLLEECAARADLERRFAEQAREITRLLDADGSRIAGLRASALREARSIAVEEIADASQELDRLRALLERQDDARRDFDARLRQERELRTSLEADLERAEAAREAAQRGLDRATQTVSRRVEEEAERTHEFELRLDELTRERDRLRNVLASHPSASDLEQFANQLDARERTILELRMRVDELETESAALRAAPSTEAVQNALEEERDAARL